MKNLKEIAKKELSISELMAGKEKITIDDLIFDYPDGITVNQIDLVEIGDDRYYIGTFAEDSTKFFNGGCIFNQLCDKFVSECGSIEVVNDDLPQAGLIFKFTHGKTKNGKSITKIELK